VRAPETALLASTLAMSLVHLRRQSGPRRPSGHPKVRLNTSMGDMVLELYPDKAPKTVENFLQYVRDKHYDGTVFHRVITTS
jgi:peptidyl-prolyl cis-trans isomerase A (cyclophilin A)